ncbi:hypothetical protein EJ02DRAFT_250807 [Clathrospora elynae]|uniref:Uncharacterized protein n=1 Tax=Clathrospora elynae TaxID=706981 RepID=A0A6A5TBR9_9PLEO|nr:hypothetical protein EJ02DRAFT_250807 [Clathrospora elynae]
MSESPIECVLKWCWATAYKSGSTVCDDTPKAYALSGTRCKLHTAPPSAILVLVPISLSSAKHPEISLLFKDTDIFNERPRTCVTQRKRYLNSTIVQRVVEARVVNNTEDGVKVFACMLAEKDDTLCRSCAEVLRRYSEFWDREYFDRGLGVVSAGLDVAVC